MGSAKQKRAERTASPLEAAPVLNFDPTMRPAVYLDPLHPPVEGQNGERCETAADAVACMGLIRLTHPALPQ